jgi:hypothetical protein
MMDTARTAGRIGRRWCACAIIAAAGIWAVAAPVFAQQQEGAAPLQETKPVIEWAIGAGFILVSLAVAFKNSKRSHVQ